MGAVLATATLENPSTTPPAAKTMCGDVSRNKMDALTKQDVDKWRTVADLLSADRIEELSENGEVYDGEKRQELLLTAICHRQTDVVRAFLKGGADPNKAVSGVSPLIVAVELNDVSCIRLLLEFGAKTGVKSSAGVSVLGKSIKYCVPLGSVSSLDVLLAHGADPDLADSFTMTPLEHGVNQHNHKAINRLLDAGADVNKMSVSLLESLVPHMDACFHFCPPNYNLPETLVRLFGDFKYRPEDADAMRRIILRFLDVASIIWKIIKDWDDHHRWESYLDIVRLCCSVGYTPSADHMRQIKRMFPPKVYKTRLERFIEKPRSLKDLCRVFLRNSTEARVQDKAKVLPLPSDLQDFITIRNRVHFTRI